MAFYIKNQKGNIIKSNGKDLYIQNNSIWCGEKILGIYEDYDKLIDQFIKLKKLIKFSYGRKFFTLS